MSMAASIESRVPFLDHKLVEFAAGCPTTGSCPAGTTKRILREAMKGAAPGVDPDAAEDGLPGAVLRAGRADALERRRARRPARPPHPRARPDRIRRPSTRCSTSTLRARIDAGDAIWSLMNLELWYRTFIDSEGVQTLSAPRPA